MIAKVAGIEVELGRPVDIILNNICILHNKKFTAMSDKKWAEYDQTNTVSGVRLSRRFLPKMLERNTFGRIVLVSSKAVLKPVPSSIAYSVSKTSELSLSIGLAELTKGSNNVTVNDVLPDPTMTKGMQDLKASWAAEYGFDSNIASAEAHCVKEFETTSLLQRFLNADEIFCVRRHIPLQSAGTQY